MNRRQFGAAIAATAVLPRLVRAADAPAAKIERIDVYPLYYPMTGYFKFFSGAKGSSGRAAAVVKITADNGEVGWGESVPIPKWSYETLETATTVLRDYYAPELIGRDPTDMEGALAAMDLVVAPGFTTGMPISRAGIDLALHDLTGKLKNQSLAEMWGRDPGGPITLSWTVNVQTLQDVEASLEEGRRRGYRNFNIKVAPDPRFDVELAKSVF